MKLFAEPEVSGLGKPVTVSEEAAAATTVIFDSVPVSGLVDDIGCGNRLSARRFERGREGVYACVRRREGVVGRQCRVGIGAAELDGACVRGVGLFRWGQPQ